jgi:DNA-binding transcriptional ArsR family regulator
MTDVFSAISDPTRRAILERLHRDGPLSVRQLSEPLSMSRQAVTKHLDILEAAELIESEFRGRQRIHRLRARPLEAIDTWLAPFAAFWDDRLARLRHHLEEDDE